MGARPHRASRSPTRWASRWGPRACSRSGPSDDECEEDVFGAEGGSILRFTDVGQALEWCVARGIELVEADSPTFFDFSPIAAWLDGSDAMPSAADLLDFVNTAADIRRTLDEVVPPEPDTLYQQLVAGSVPWVMGLPEEYVPVWDDDVLELRDYATRARATLRRGLGL